MFSIKVIESSTGRPVKGAKVSVYINNGITHFGFTRDVYTDYDGEAHFDKDNCNGTIYVDGREMYEGRIEGRKVIYV
ncbi:MAG: hypothetical protein K6F40_02050 [Bacteroidales bacterium]|nr:hypothetical protein [Bacteroidales bacterium]